MRAVEHKLAIEQNATACREATAESDCEPYTTSCGGERPGASACVFHLRLGEVFTDLPPHRTASQLWEGKNKQGDAFREAFHERYIQTRAFFDRALRSLPNGTTHAVIAGNADALLTRNSSGLDPAQRSFEDAAAATLVQGGSRCEYIGAAPCGRVHHAAPPLAVVEGAACRAPPQLTAARVPRRRLRLPLHGSGEMTRDILCTFSIPRLHRRDVAIVQDRGPGSKFGPPTGALLRR